MAGREACCPGAAAGRVAERPISPDQIGRSQGEKNNGRENIISNSYYNLDCYNHDYMLLRDTKEEINKNYE